MDAARSTPKFASPSSLATLGGLTQADSGEAEEERDAAAENRKKSNKKKGRRAPVAKPATVKPAKKVKPSAPSAGTPVAKIKPVAKVKPSAPPPPRAAKKPEPAAEPPAQPAPSRERDTPASSEFRMSTSQLRSLFADDPALLEEGLEVFMDGKGEPVGVGYESAVGEIDLLARDGRGDLVVVMVAEDKPGDEIVAELLKRVGWVRKNLSAEVESVRGLVVLDAPSDDVMYAAAAVAGMVSFKTYRMRVVFEDVTD